MTLDAGEDGRSSFQSPSPDDSGDPDTAEMADDGEDVSKSGSQAQSGNGQPKSSSNAKDPTRPRRKKARRDERPCQRCIKRGLQDACQDGVRKKAKYLHDAPAETLMPPMGLRGAIGHQVHYLANMGRGQPLPSDASFQGPSVSDVFIQQQNMPTAYPNYHANGTPGQMGPPLTDGMVAAQAYSDQQSPISPQYSSGPSHQQSPMQSMAHAMQQNSQANTNLMPTAFGGSVFNIGDPMQYDFNPSSFNFDNHYGALEFGMLGQMSSGAVETPGTDSATQISQGNSTSYTTPGTISSTGFGGSPTTAKSYFYPQDQGLAEWPHNAQQTAVKPAQYDQSGHGQDPASIGTMKQQEASHAYSIGAGSSNFASPSDTSSTLTGFGESPRAANTYQAANPRQNMQDRAAQQRQPPSKMANPNRPAPVVPARRARDASSVYESVKQPYSYTKGFHGLTAFLQRRFSPQKTLRIAKALASIRPSFISCTKTLNRDDLIFMEKCFQRTLWEYEDFINAYGTPTIVCRRTGEVAAVGKEFTLLTGWKKDVLLGKEPNLNVNTGGSSAQSSSASSTKGGFNTPRVPDPPKSDQSGSRAQPVFLAELLDDDSTIAFYEDFARLAFGDSRGSVTTRCKLLKYRTKADEDSGLTAHTDLDASEVGSRLKHKQRVARGVKNESQDSPSVYRLGEMDGKVDCSYCWTVKRDVFDIPMLIVMNVRSCSTNRRYLVG
ncbi:MAG: hypothetical protein Q9220_000566 [cf. Caloplaca sp. 1 TL-2023]